MFYTCQDFFLKSIVSLRMNTIGLADLVISLTADLIGKDDIVLIYLSLVSQWSNTYSDTGQVIPCKS